MKVGGQILWNVTSQICYLMGRRLMKDVFGQPFQGSDHSIWFTGWVLPCNCEGPVKNPSIWKESFTWIVPLIRFVRGENLEGWRTGCRPWGVGNDGRIGKLLQKTQCERGDISQRQRRVGRDQDLRTSTLIRHRPIRGGSNIDFPGDSEGSLPQPQDSFLDAGEAINDVWSMSGNFRYRHHVEPRVKLYSPREESFPVPLSFIDVSRTTHTNLDVMPERRIDDGTSMDPEIFLILGQVSHNLLYWKKNLLTDTCGPGGDYSENSLHPGQVIMARNLEINGKACQAEEEAKVVSWKAPSGERTKIARDPFHRPGG